MTENAHVVVDHKPKHLFIKFTRQLLIWTSSSSYRPFEPDLQISKLWAQNCCCYNETSTIVFNPVSAINNLYVRVPNCEDSVSYNNVHVGDECVWVCQLSCKIVCFLPMNSRTIRLERPRIDGARWLYKPNATPSLPSVDEFGSNRPRKPSPTIHFIKTAKAIMGRQVFLPAGLLLLGYVLLVMATGADGQAYQTGVSCNRISI